MNKQKRTYLPTQVKSGRHTLGRAARPSASAGLLNAFRSTAARLGAQFNLPAPEELSVAENRSSAEVSAGIEQFLR